MASKKIDERILELRQDYAARAEERRELERAWIVDINYYNGNQYAECLPTGALVNAGKRYPWQFTSVYNHIAPIIEARMAKFNRMNTDITCLSASDNPIDELSAKFATKLLKYVKENNDLAALRAEAAYWAEICGTVFYKVCWDKSKGRLLTSDGMREGDVSVTVCPPQEIYPDSLFARGVEDCHSIIHAKAYPKQIVEDAWGVRIETDETGATVMTHGEGLDGTSILCGKEKDGYVLVIERYSLPTGEYPDGRLLIACGDNVLYDGVLPYETGRHGKRGLPFVRQVSIPSPTMFFGSSLVERMIPIQRAYNEVKNRKQEFFSRMTAGVLLAEDGSVDMDDLEEEGIAPGKVIVYRQGSEKPEMLSLCAMPPELNDEEDRLLKEIISVSGVTDFLVTGIFTGLNYSGTALNIMTEQSNNRLCVTTESILNAQKNVAMKILRLYKQFATSEQLACVENAAYGESDAFKIAEITAEDLIFKHNNGQIGTETDKRSLAKDIYSMKLLEDDDGKITTESKRKLLELLGYEGLANVRNLDELNRLKAEKENTEAIKRIPTVSELDNHEEHERIHTAFMMTDASEAEKQIIANHIAEHRKFRNKTQAEEDE